MLNRLDEMLNFHTQALRVRDQRQQVLASNIANADTPNYKARDLDFNTALQTALKGSGTGAPAAGGGVRLATTAPGHLAGAPGLGAGAGLLYRNPAQGSVDGNTVDVDAERAAMAENTIHYEFNLTRLGQQIKGLLSAIQG
ncbi:MAG: flagellar basal body rod protein FlgB [Thiobacillus sp.]|uniref:flagellar basal body rod protein FlgB n=1 Tax=Thiobacillus sp. TaxID=924 RepID=UPI00273559FC|nr:flagellar basal body rod protein FlgB [Thiobacillus sp.]MDP3421863.1 flagellar basal body rod protein FlgB [Thiobacillus sp.]MDP3585443.1 flagellar basal body rod protein FlgB [Thiobacillus sp.]